jgi:hypothetical protein
MKLSFIIWCIVGCCIPSDEIFAEKYETKVMRKDIYGSYVVFYFSFCLIRF